MTIQTPEDRPHQHRLIKPGRPRLCTTYKFMAQAGHLVKSPISPFEETARRVLGWLGEKAPRALPPKAAKLESFIMEEHGQRIECVSLPDHGIWSCRFSHPDSGLRDISAVPGRHWTIDIGIQAKDTQTHFGIQVTCASLPNCDEPLALIRPGIIKNLTRDVGLKEARLLDGQPWIIHTEDDLQSLKQLLIASDRHMPVIVMSQPDSRHWEYTPTAPTYMLDANWLARELIGYAYVVCLPWKLAFEWTKTVGKEWSVFDGAVRQYMPGLDFDEDSYLAHILHQKDNIRWFKFREHNGEKAFGNFLFYSARIYNVRAKLDWPFIRFITDARLIQAETLTQNLIHSEQCVQCKAQFEIKLGAFKKSLEESQTEAEQWSDEAVQAGRDRDHHVRENSALRYQIDVLRSSLETKTGKSIDADIPIPNTFEDLPEWVEKHLAGRLLLHPRALRGIKSAEYEDVSLAYKGLLLLGNEYRNVRISQSEYKVFDSACQALQLSCSGSIDKSRAGQEGDTYFLRYPIGTPNQQFMDLHLRKGSAKDNRYCLAIYFFWDDETRQVVVGWLPSHLQNRLS